MSWKDNFPKENRYFETDNGILYCGDCLEIMKTFPKESVDLVLTDPPYGVGSNETNGIDYTDNYFNVNEVSDLLFNLLKENTRLFCFIAQKTLFQTICDFDKQFDFHQILVWHKPNFAGGGKKVYDFTSSYEFILLFHKGKPVKLKNPRDISNEYLSNSDVLKYTQPQSNFKKDKRYHIHQKPLKLIEHLILASTNENNLVLDPFIGSGTTAVVAEKLNRRWIGIEISPEYCEIAKQRILNLKGDEE